MPRSTAIAVLACVAALALPAAAAGSITEFPVPTAQSGPTGITAGPDGALWFTEGSGQIGRITTSGSITEFPIPSPGSVPTGITTGPDGALWFAEQLGGIGRITTGGSATELSFPNGQHRPFDIAAGADGALWFTDGDHNSIGRVTTAGAFTDFPIGTTCCGPGGITRGPDGAVWFTEILTDFHGEIDRIASNGTITRFPIPTTPTQPEGIVTGPDGALWFADSGGNSIGRMTTSGSFTRFPIRTPNSGATAIATGPDGALWFTEQFAGKIGRVTTAGNVSDFRTASPPHDIAAGADGALWFTEQGADKIGRITTDQPAEDSVDGILFTEPPCDPPQIGCTKPRYLFGASSTASGQNAFGTVAYVTGERAGVFEDDGTVTCLSVHGNRATVGVNFDFPPDGTAPQSQSALIFLEDNGPVDQDRFAVQPLPGTTAPATCPASPPAGLALGPGYPGVAGGDGPGVVIVDAQAVPTTKEQCRHGGYRQFGFKNQGHCIAFVVHQAVRACLAEHKRNLWAVLRCIRRATGP